MTTSNFIQKVTEFPIPFDPDKIREIQEESIEGETNPGPNNEDDIIEGVDEFHDRHTQTLHRVDDWRVFKVSPWIVGGGYVYFWNRNEWGFKVEDSWEAMMPLVKLMDSFTEEYNEEDFEPTYYPWELP